MNDLLYFLYYILVIFCIEEHLYKMSNYLLTQKI